MERDRYARSRERHSAAAEVLAGGVSSNFRLGAHPVPLTFSVASGSHMRDVDGNDYIDYTLGMGPSILGHAPALVLDAVRDTLDVGQLFAGQNEIEIRLAREVQELVPCAERVRFGMSGSEMIQAALRLARAWTGRTTVIKFEGHYHGWLDNIFVNIAVHPAEADGSMAVAGQSDGQVLPHDVVVIPWNDAEALRGALRDHGSDVAAVLMEPVMCNTSVIEPRAGYLDEVRRACDDAGALLVFDEVITGFRLALGGAQQRYGVVPDLCVLAKALGGGFPIAALGGRAAVMDLAAGSVIHGGTYNANTVSVAASLATLKGLRQDNLAAYSRIDASGSALVQGLQRVGEPHRLSVQGLPSVFNTTFGVTEEITDARGYAASDLARQRQFLFALQDEGVRTTSRGTWFVSAAHTEDDVSRTLKAVERALATLPTLPTPVGAGA